MITQRLVRTSDLPTQCVLLERRLRVALCPF